MFVTRVHNSDKLVIPDRLGEASSMTPRFETQYGVVTVFIRWNFGGNCLKLLSMYSCSDFVGTALIGSSRYFCFQRLCLETGR